MVGTKGTCGWHNVTSAATFVCVCLFVCLCCLFVTVSANDKTDGVQKSEKSQSAEAAKQELDLEVETLSN